MDLTRITTTPFYKVEMLPCHSGYSLVSFKINTEDKARRAENAWLRWVQSKTKAKRFPHAFHEHETCREITYMLATSWYFVLKERTKEFTKEGLCSQKVTITYSQKMFFIIDSPFKSCTIKGCRTRCTGQAGPGYD